MGDVVKLNPAQMPMRLRVVDSPNWPEPAFSNEARLVEDPTRPVIPPARPWVLPEFPKEPA